MDINQSQLITSALEWRHLSMPSEGFGRAIPRILYWLNQYKGIEAHIAWDFELPEAAVATYLQTAPPQSLLGTLRGLTQLGFNEQVVFLHKETTEAMVYWNPLEQSLLDFDTHQAAWSYRGAKPIATLEALIQYVCV